MRYRILIPELGFDRSKPYGSSENIDELIQRVNTLRSTMNTSIYIHDESQMNMKGLVYVTISEDFIKLKRKSYIGEI